jgi:hypothetical protein
VRGSPIRTSSDQRSVGSSPRLIAASYVLHRLLVPRHPPCALNNLATQNLQTTNPHPRHRTPPTRRQAPHNAGTRGPELSKDARVHCAVLNERPATPHTTPPNPTSPQTVSGTRREEPRHEGTPHPREKGAGPFLQDPTACLRPPDEKPGPVPCSPRGEPYWRPATAGGRTGQRSTLEHHPDNPHQIHDGPGVSF